jgi:hypothetical protein
VSYWTAHSSQRRFTFNIHFLAAIHV